MRVYIANRNNGREYRVNLTPAQARRLDNGMLVSCGLSVPDDLSEKQFRRLKPVPVEKSEYLHSGCLSSCTLRGGAKCAW